MARVYEGSSSRAAKHAGTLVVSSGSKPRIRPLPEQPRRLAKGTLARVLFQTMLERTGLRDEIGADNVFVLIRSASATCTSAFGWDARWCSSAHCLRASRLASEDSGVELCRSRRPALRGSLRWRSPIPPAARWLATTRLAPSARLERPPAPDRILQERRSPRTSL